MCAEVDIIIPMHPPQLEDRAHTTWKNMIIDFEDIRNCRGDGPWNM